MAGELSEYQRWIRRRACAACGSSPPSEAHHATGAGMGLRGHDSSLIPLCHMCHIHGIHGNGGIFEGMSKEARRDWQGEQATRHWRQFVGEFETRDIDTETDEDVLF